MLNKIINSDLFCHLRQDCCENSIGITFDRCLLKGNGDLNEENVLIIKVDDYYSSRNMHNPPQSVDCLIIIKCITTNKLKLYLVELRNTRNQRSVRSREIVGKFRTVIENFIENNIFSIISGGCENIIDIVCLLVTNPFQFDSSTSEADYRKYIKGTALDAYTSLDLGVHCGKLLMINPVMPSPTITCC